MTIRKKPESDEFEVTGPAMWKFLAGKIGSYRIFLFILVASMHPVGRQIIGTFGFEFPDQKKVTVAAEGAQEAKVQMTQLVVDIRELKQDVTSIKANNAIVNSKVDNLEQTFHGFQIDWSKYKSQKEQPQ